MCYTCEPSDFLRVTIVSPQPVRNIAVHHYEEIDWAIVHGIALNHLSDFSEFAKVIASRLT